MPLNDITTGSVINGTATSDLHATCRAEIERLRAALQKIDERATLTGQYTFGDMAREALGNDRQD